MKKEKKFKAVKLDVLDSGTITFSRGVCDYKRVGNTVYCNYTIQLNSKGFIHTLPLPFAEEKK